MPVLPLRGRLPGRSRYLPSCSDDRTLRRGGRPY